MDINFINYYEENCLLLACRDYSNIDTIKYLIGDCKINTNFIHDNGNNYLF